MEKQGDACRDAAVVQLFLSQVPDGRKPSQGASLTGSEKSPAIINRRGDDRSCNALKHYRDKVAKVKDPYPEMLRELEKTVLGK